MGAICGCRRPKDSSPPNVRDENWPLGRSIQMVPKGSGFLTTSWTSACAELAEKDKSNLEPDNIARPYCAFSVYL
jgi:hypothetical protein